MDLQKFSTDTSQPTPSLYEIKLFERWYSKWKTARAKLELPLLSPSDRDLYQYREESASYTLTRISARYPHYQFHQAVEEFIFKSKSDQTQLFA